MDYPTIDMVATGENINKIRKARGISVADLQAYFGMNNRNSIYKWFRGESLPTLENLYALSVYLEVSMDELVIHDPAGMQIRACGTQVRELSGKEK